MSPKYVAAGIILITSEYMNLLYFFYTAWQFVVKFSTGIPNTFLCHICSIWYWCVVCVT